MSLPLHSAPQFQYLTDSIRLLYTILYTYHHDVIVPLLFLAFVLIYYYTLRDRNTTSNNKSAVSVDYCYILLLACFTVHLPCLS